jgi:hypothetical protein
MMLFRLEQSRQGPLSLVFTLGKFCSEYTSLHQAMFLQGCQRFLISDTVLQVRVLFLTFRKLG